MMSALWNFASFVVALGILVAVHEFGHFWVARKCGVIVQKFSIGFGKPLWKTVGKDGTEYSLSMIPLGGFVKMLDERVEEVPEHLKNRAFNNKTLWQRSAIVAAGPVANFLFAIFAYWVIFIIGIPAIKPVIGEVSPQSIVAQAGIEQGMELKAVSGIKTTDWQSANMALISHIGDDSMTLTVVSPDNPSFEQVKTLDLADWQYDPETQSAMRTLGFVPFSPAVTLTLALVNEESAAQRAGLQVDDKLLTMGNEPLHKWQQVVESIRNHANKPLEVSVERSGKEITLLLTPDSKANSDGTQIGYAGIAPYSEEWPDNYKFDLQYGVFESVGQAIDKTGQLIGVTLSMVKKLFTGDVALKNLSGPISIAKGAGMTADYGLVYFLSFLALISVNLGIINLLPLPVLDGGHLLFFAIEAVIRRPVPEKIQEVGYKIGTAAIITMMMVALFNDFTRL
ncbi:sigma E protease regulator RseP [Aliivibrio kagoshimensis]|uniref:sigma E protease regulator RseP n=1 Tax=Aliivibrio kagoshimensis TaxID=2910230 RepID=UPI003D13EA5E